MSSKDINNNHLRGLIIKDFNLEEDQFDNVSADLQDIKKRLIQVLDYMLTKDFERLLNAMYRLDINETLFRDVIEGQKGNNISELLADLIIDRELQKVQTRLKYKDKI